MLNISKKLHWTSHAKSKMNYYRLSEARVRRVLHSPHRIEEGIAPDTIAMMQPVSIRRTDKGQEDWTQEIWLMIEETKSERKIISVWRYPGKTKPGDPIPESIRREISGVLY